MKEQRKAERIRVSTLASFFCEREVIAGIIQNLSPHGARVLTEAALQVGDTVEMKVDLPEGRGAIRAVAQVVWQEPSKDRFHPHLVGLEFVRVDENELARLEQFAAEHEEISIKIH